MNFISFLPEFNETYDSDKKEKAWAELSARFRDFWADRVMGPDSDPISDDDCDKAIIYSTSRGSICPGISKISGQFMPR